MTTETKSRWTRVKSIAWRAFAVLGFALGLHLFFMWGILWQMSLAIVGAIGVLAVLAVAMQLEKLRKTICGLTCPDCGASLVRLKPRRPGEDRP